MALTAGLGNAKTFMTGRDFLDTNILVYAVDDADPAKQDIARALLTKADNIVISAQVLNEFYVTITRKLKPVVAPEAAAKMVRALARLPCVAIDAQLVQLALHAGQRWQLSTTGASIARHSCRTSPSRSSESVSH